MDPTATLSAVLEGTAGSRFAYNSWVQHGGFKVVAKVRPHTDTWMRGIRSVRVDTVGISYLHCTHVPTGKKVRLPFAAVEVEPW